MYLESLLLFESVRVFFGGFSCSCFCAVFFLHLIFARERACLPEWWPQTLARLPLEEGNKKTLAPLDEVVFPWTYCG